VRVTDNGLPPLSAARSFTASVVEIVPQPGLLILLQDNSVDVSWPANSAGYVLQTCGSLTEQPGTNWTTFTGPAITNVDTISITFSVTTNQFFRLVKP